MAKKQKSKKSSAKKNNLAEQVVEPATEDVTPTSKQVFVSKKNSAKKNNLAEQAINDAKPTAKLVLIVPQNKEMSWHDKQTNGLHLSDELNYLHMYGVNKTDQLHGASIAEMFAQGQGEVKEDELNNFEFQNGFDDGTLSGVPMSELDHADPAELFESEVKVKREISRSINTQIQKRKEEQVIAEARKKAQSQQKTSENLPEKTGTV